jgi:membrane dipeptidase
VDLPRLREGNVGLQVFAVYVPPETEISKAFDYTSVRLDVIDAFAHSDEFLTLVETAAEHKANMASGKVGIMLAVENGLAIEDSFEKLEQLRRRKVRIMTLVHSDHMSWIASCTGKGQFSSDSSQSRELSRFGEKVVDAMHDLGIIPDVSHASEKAFWDIIKRSKKPVIASHSCAYNLCAAARNLKDDQLKALGDSGGVVGINFFSGFLNEPYRLQFDEIIKNDPSLFTQIMETKHVPGISVSVPMTDIADHIDYILNMAGEDCVALGSDFDGIPAAPDGVTGSDYYLLLEKELRSRGYSEKRIEKIFNANFIRVLEAWD